MTTHGLLARIDAAPGREDDLEDLLAKARVLAEAEPATTAWWALRFGRGEYGIFDAFANQRGREEHLNGQIVAELQANAGMLDGPPRIEAVDIIADELSPAAATKAIALRLPIKTEHADDAHRFLVGARSAARAEEGTVNWFALRFEDGAYGVFDVFPTTRDRRAHLMGEIPRQIALHGLPWLRGLPELALADVLAEKTPA